jgi:hypothetical protein
MAPRSSSPNPGNSSKDPRGTDRTGLNKDERTTNTGAQPGSERNARKEQDRPGTQGRAAEDPQAGPGNTSRSSTYQNTARDTLSTNRGSRTASKAARPEDTTETYLEDDVDVRRETEEDGQ